MNLIRNVLKRRTEYFNPSKENAYIELGNSILNMVYEMDTEGREIIVVCIGTDRATGDALGPLVGDFLFDGGFELWCSRNFAISGSRTKYQRNHKQYLYGIQ